MNIFKDSFKPLNNIAEIWNTAFNAAVERLPKRALEIMLILLTVAVILMAFVAELGVFLLVLIYVLLS